MSYWEDRAEALQAYYDRRSAKTLRTVSRAYDRMVKQLHEDTEKIIGNFAFYYDLTRDQAMELLRQPAPMSVLDDLRERLTTITDKRMRTTLEARLSAPAYAARINRIQAIRESARVNAVQAADVENTVGQVHMRDILFEGYQRTMFDIQQYTGLGFGFSGVDNRRLNQILRYNWSGKQFSQRVWTNANVTAQNLSQALTEVIMHGKTSRQTFDALMEEANGSRFAANRLLRTETNYISNQATAEAYAEAGIERYRYMAVLDGRTSKKCADLDGREFLLSEKEVGVNYPPTHPWCRSHVACVIDGVAYEKMQRWARDPETGEEMKVPRDMNYREWKRWQEDGAPADIQNWRDSKNPKPVVTIDKNSDFMLKLGEEHYSKITEIANNAPEVPRAVWGKNQSSVKIATGSYTGQTAYNDDFGIHVNVAKDAKGTRLKLPFADTFHESWHNIDHRLGNGNVPLSASGKFGETLKADFKQLVESKRAPTSTGRIPSRKEAMKSIAREFFYMDGREAGGIMDIMEGASGGAFETMIGHGKEYWKQRFMLEKEAFAAIGEMAMTNPNGYKMFQELFPESHKMWLEMLKGVL